MLNRREFQKHLTTGAMLGLGIGSLPQSVAGVEEETPAFKLGRAEHCIFVWLGGGACHIDTFDPKRVGDPKQASKAPGSAYRAIDTAIQGAQLCEHMPLCAGILDRGVLLRSVFHNVIDEHAAAVNRMHVGRPPTGTTQYPSIGSVILNQRGTVAEGIPGYVVAGYPSATRGPGFLGAQNGYIYLTDTDAGPAGLRRPSDVDSSRAARRESLLKQQAEEFEKAVADSKVKDYVRNSAFAQELASPKFMNVFDLKSEPADLREKYGGEFGQRCLLSRRLIENGVRFVEVSFNLNFINGTGWDTHNEGQQNQHILIQQLDQSLHALVVDLEARKLLDKTLIAVATEFGRPPEFDGRGGRGHHSKAFSCVLFGGGLKTGQAVGVTDDFGREIVDEKVSVADFHATIYSAMQIDPTVLLYDGERPVPITDNGKPIQRLFA